MIRATLILSLVLATGPLSAQSELTERPGRWLTVPQTGAPGGAEQPAPLLQEAEGSVPVIEMTIPAPGPDLSGLQARVAAPPDTRPVPRPLVEADPALDAPEIEITELDTDPAIRPLPRPHTADAAERAEALADELADEAEVRVANAARTTPTPERSAVPDVTLDIGMIEVAAVTAPLAAVLLPDQVRASNRRLEPEAVATPRNDRAPVVSVTRPRGPEVQEAVATLVTRQTARLSAVLTPRWTDRPGAMPSVTLAAAPMLDRFPASALPPGSLPEGPEGLDQVEQPGIPNAQANAAVLMTRSTTLPDRMRAPAPPALPVRSSPPLDPEAPLVLPEAHPGAVARVIEDAMICWRLAGLSPEARWAQLTVDMALDDTNMPAVSSIRLTGFRGVVSGIAAEAYEAAHGALAGCAEATQAEPATAAVELVFDRDGIWLR